MSASFFEELAISTSDYYLGSGSQGAQTGRMLATVHHAENTDDPARLGSILAALGTCP